MQKTSSKSITRRRFIRAGMGTAGGVLLSSCSGADSNDCECQARQAPPSKAHVYIEGNNRIFESNGVPGHATGIFPSPSDPYAIGDREYRFMVPLNPEKNPDGPIPINYWRFGIALNGVTFDPAGPGLVQGWQFEVLSFTASKHLGIDASMEEQLQLLELQINALPERQRTAINLCYHTGLSNQEAASVMQVSLKALQSLLARAKSNIKHHL